MYRVKKSKHTWYNTMCIKAKKRKDAAWKKIRKYRNEKKKKKQ